MTKSMPIAVISLAVVSLAATAALVGEPAGSAKTVTGLSTTAQTSADWNRRGTRTGGELAAGSTDGISADLPRRGLRDSHKAVAGLYETPDEWARRGTR